MINVIISRMDLSKFNQQEEIVKKHTDQVEQIQKEILTIISTLQADFTSNVVKVEKKIEDIAKTHAQEIRIKEFETQLESKFYDAEHKQRVLDMFKVQNQQLNLKLVKLWKTRMLK